MVFSGRDVPGIGMLIRPVGFARVLIAEAVDCLLACDGWAAATGRSESSGMARMGRRGTFCSSYILNFLF